MLLPMTEAVTKLTERLYPIYFPADKLQQRALILLRIEARYGAQNYLYQIIFFLSRLVSVHDKSTAAFNF